MSTIDWWLKLIFASCVIRHQFLEYTRTSKITFDYILFYEKMKNVSCEYTTDWMVELNFASCVVHQTRSLDVFILHFHFLPYYYGVFELKKLFFFQKQVYLVTFLPKRSYILKPSTNHTPGARRLASVT